MTRFLSLFQMVARRTSVGSDLASIRGVRFAPASFALAASFAMASCLVTDVNPSPNRNAPPRILLPGVSNSTTTPPDRVFLLAQSDTPGRVTSLDLALDVTDEDSDRLTYRAFVIGPDANPDGGTSTGYVRRFAVDGGILLVNGRGKVSRFTIAANRFVPTGRCYGVEVRVSSAFRDATDGASPETPATEGDVSSILYWVASYGVADTSIDLGSCPSQP